MNYPYQRLFGVKTAGEVPAYRIPDAAHHLHVPTGTVRAWVSGRTYPTESGVQRTVPIVPLSNHSGRLLSFQDLIELGVVRALRRKGVTLAKVREAVEYIRKEFGVDRPLLSGSLLTNNRDVFIEKYGNYLQIGAHGQLAMKKILQSFMSRIEWQDGSAPTILYPLISGTETASDAPRLISINPRVRFGQSCITGTVIPTAIVAGRFKAGDTRGVLADDYERPIEEIDAAIRYEIREAS